MATIDIRLGQIRDRTVGYKPMSYCVGNKSKKFFEACLKAHEIIMGVLAPQARESITPREVKSAVLAYVALDNSGKKELLKKIALSGYGTKVEKPSISLEELLNAWFEQKSAEGITDKMAKTMAACKNVMLNFFESHGFKTTADLKPDTAHKFLQWRSKTNFLSGYKGISSSVLKHELQALKQMAKIAARNGWISNRDIWDDVQVRRIAGANVKVVEPLPVSLQKEILSTLGVMDPRYHDAILLLLVTGMRIGEFDTLKPDSIKNNSIALHGEGIGSHKPASGKTASAARTLPVCPTLARIFERGHIFTISANAIKTFLKRNPFAVRHPGIHPHRLRHTFAVNKLLSQTGLQMVSYQLGHSDISTTANLYGKFVPEHFKAGFEEAIKERKELVEWLEGGYFSIFKA